MSLMTNNFIKVSKSKPVLFIISLAAIVVSMAAVFFYEGKAYYAYVSTRDQEKETTSMFACGDESFDAVSVFRTIQSDERLPGIVDGTVSDDYCCGIYLSDWIRPEYVSKGFFDTLPKSLDEAARVDGANRAQVLFKVILPLSKPIVIYTLLTSFMGPWGDFVFARYVSFGTSDGMNVAVGLQNMLGSAGSINANYTTFCAGGVVVAIPITILFMCLQKYYVEGVTGGAVKG